MRQLNVKIAVTLSIMIAVLLLGSYLNEYTERMYSKRQFHIQQYDFDPDSIDQEARIEPYTRPFGPREYIRIYPKNTGE